MKPKAINKTVLLISLALVDYIAAVDETQLVIALPKIMEDFGLTLYQTQWIQNIYVIFISAFLIISGLLSDRFGHKRTFVTGAVIFFFSSLANAFSTSYEIILVSRALQGIGAAMFFASSMAIISIIWVGNTKKAFSVTAIFSAIGLIVGPALGGFITGLTIHNISGWHWLFIFNNCTTVLVGLGLFFYSGVPEINFQTKPELKNIWQIFTNKSFTIICLIAFICFAMFLGMQLILSFYLQNLKGYSVEKAGLILAIIPLGMMLFAGLTERFKNLVQTLIQGIILAIFSLLFISWGIKFDDLNWLIFGLIIMGVSGGFVYPVIYSYPMEIIDEDKKATAAGIFDSFTQIGVAVGIFVAVAVFQNLINYLLTNSNDLITTENIKVILNFENISLIGDINQEVIKLITTALYFTVINFIFFTLISLLMSIFGLKKVIMKPDK